MTAQPAPVLTGDGLHKIRRALISVSDKSGIIDFARALAARDVEILSTGGTARSLSDAGIKVTDVSQVTGFPEIMDGRVKTLHPKVHGGLLARRDLDHHVAAMTDHGIEGIDLLVVNLYPFETTVAGGADFATCIENIDIGGPAMIRAAAKNHDFVTVIVDPADYDLVLDDLEANDGSTLLETRRALAGTAFRRTAAYDAAIGQYFAQLADEKFPERLTITATRGQILRYGENPHQEAAIYLTDPPLPGVARARQIQGKELSYNNLNDTDAALDLLSELPDKKPAVVIVKHANPCGVATADSLVEAYGQAFDCDPVSAFGGIIAVNQILDGPTAEAIGQIFTEVIIAPGADADARAIIAAKKNLRLLLLDKRPDPAKAGMIVKSIQGGLLVQSRDNGRVNFGDFTTVTKRAPTDQEMDDMLFAFRVAKHVKSNAIVFAKNGATVGIGAGQMSRVDSSRIAIAKAEDIAKERGWPSARTFGAVVASDAFLPFADGLEAAIAAGATAMIQPGGSIRDAEVIEAADRAGMAMIFTGMRHFRH